MMKLGFIKNPPASSNSSASNSRAGSRRPSLNTGSVGEKRGNNAGSLSTKRGNSAGSPSEKRGNDAGSPSEKKPDVRLVPTPDGQQANGGCGRRRPPPGPALDKQASNFRLQGARDSTRLSLVQIEGAELSSSRHGERGAMSHAVPSLPAEHPYTEPCVTVTYASDYQASESPKSAPDTEFSKRTFPPRLQPLSPMSEESVNGNGPSASQSPRSPRVSSPRRW